jgi:biotin-dependent carboxylase-like uncharacterized protein
MGPKLEFADEANIDITGGNLSPILNGNPVPMWRSVGVEKGSVLSFGLCKSGCRAYLSVSCGIDVPSFLGSKSTYVQGGIGGVGGRKLAKGDAVRTGASRLGSRDVKGRRLKESLIPNYPTELELRVILGPQDDYLEDDFLLEMYASGNYAWKVSPLFDRVGVRLSGPAHKWRPPERRPPSGAHPSNINLVYCGLGIVGVAGEVPTVCGVDGVSLTGYTSVATLIGADMWRLAQVKAYDKIRFRAVTLDEARRAREELDNMVGGKNAIVEST